MGVDVLLGLQWGDEGKGKIVDFLAPKYQLVARFQGGPNAGHTLEFDGIKHVLHQIPSGIFRADIQNLIGNGVVLDPVIFRKEIAALKELQIDALKNLFISKRTQIILPTHGLLDAAYERSKGDKKIGSTLKGIGPAYQDKAARLGLRVGDIVSNNFNEKYTALKNRHEAILENLEYGYDLSQLEPAFFESIDFLRQFSLTEGEYLVNDALNRGEKVLAEGAQGSLLDIDFGSYPFVTSSNTMTAGACTGLGVAPRNIGSVFGVFKAYCTRVGSGPFPTELHDADGDLMRKEGNEFGSTTGRPRRCGWLDLPALRYAIMLNGVTELFMMKADVLNSFATLKVCTAYRHEDGTISDKFPFEICDAELEPVYEELPGWNQSLHNMTTFDQFPSQLSGYIHYIEAYVGVPVNLISVGPDRSQTILRKG